MNVNGKKIALITGASGGIGLACVKKFVEMGYFVAALSLPPYEEVANVFEGLDGNYKYYSANIGSKKGIDEFVSQLFRDFDKISVLVNVAGVAPRERNDILNMTEESYDFVTGVNTKGTFFLTQAIANHMLNVEGTRYIVNISSVSAYAASVNRGEYCISKAGVSMITKLFAARLAEHGIIVNEILPGIINTDMTSKVKDKYDNLIGGGLLPIKRWGQPSDIANAVYALCSGLFDYTTGASIDVDGGFALRTL